MEMGSSQLWDGDSAGEIDVKKALWNRSSTIPQSFDSIGAGNLYQEKGVVQ